MKNLIKPFLIIQGILAAGCTTLGQKANDPFTAVPVPAPAGFEWVVNDAYSDEFNGTELNSEKWHDHNPVWKGRLPGLFVPENVSVSDGYLKIKVTELTPPQGVSNEWNVACGAVQSVAQTAKYGYYEVRMKASGLSSSSTFWLINARGKTRPSKRTEFDIQECMGNAMRFPGFGKQFKSNTHVTLFPADKDAEKPTFKKGGNSEIGGQVDDAFHRYGCWWVDAKTMHFYLDGEYAHTIEVPTDLDPTPFDQPMMMNILCETYAWEKPPTPEEMQDESKNTTLYDYVRSYKLVKIAE